MTEESTPLETTTGTDIPTDDTLEFEPNVSPDDGEGVPPPESMVDNNPEDTVDSSEEINSAPTENTSNQDADSDLESIKVQLESKNSQFMRLAADFDNFRKRSAKEKADVEDRAKRQTIIELLPVIDNFERARSQIKPQSDAENNIQKSYQGIYKQFVDCLKQLGVAPMRPEGELFDPNLHEAVMREPTADHPEGTVIEELRRGYLLGDQVLRHAMVRVATAPEEPIDSDQNDEQAEESSDS